jgi:MerR family copper efflux transcriptional regulator
VGKQSAQWLLREADPSNGWKVKSVGHKEAAIMRIGEAARLSGVSAKLIRYYEGARLLSPAGRDANGYRIFDERNVHELRFIKRSRSLGFPIKQIDQLLRLWRDKQRPSRKVRDLAEVHKQTVAARMQEHRSIIKVLSHLIEACPILDELSSARGRRLQGTAPRK